MSSERVEWVEIIEPKTKEHMYANLTTGECVWDPPEGVKVKRTDSSQWWELFDINTHRFYYYNASTQTTVWHRPTDCDIIPLAKLQTLKQNTDPQKRRESATQTNQVLSQAAPCPEPHSNGATVSPAGDSPSRARREHCHRHSGARRHTDSGRSSDSSSSTRRLQESAANNIISGAMTGTAALIKKRISAHHEEKSSPHSAINRSGSFVSPRKDASDDSMHEKYFKSVESTPLTKRKLKQQSTGSSCDSASPQSPSSPLQKPQRTTSIPNATPRTSEKVEKQERSFRPERTEVTERLERDSKFERGDKSDRGERLGRFDQRPDKRLEKGDRVERGDKLERFDRDRVERYERSDKTDRNDRLERLDRGERLERGDGVRALSLQRPRLTRNTRDRCSDRHAEQSRLQSELFAGRQAAYSADQHSLRHTNYTRRQQAEPERMSSSKPSSSRRQHDSHFARQCSANEQDNMAAVNYKLKSTSLEPPLTEPNLQRHNQRLELDRAKSKRHKVEDDMEDEDILEGEVEGEEGGSPLYSNWDLRGLQHLLPLQDYILQQARLAGRCDDSGSSRSSSGSEPDSSLSGHEPDNESSGGARTPDDDDGSGVYLPHAHGDVEYMNHGVSYYNTFVGFERDRQPSPGIHRTSSLSCASAPPPLYSPVRSHPPTHPPPEQDIEVFAKDHLNFNKGIFRKKASVRDMLSWTSSSISAPMVGAAWDKPHKKAAIDLFRLVQIYMGDRKARPGMTLNSVAQDILHTVFNNEKLRDEVYVQLCRQTTENPARDSLLRGWELLCMCLSCVPPSPAFQPALTNYVNRHRDPAFADAFPEVGKWPIHVQVSHYAGVASKRLERIGVGGRRAARAPTTDDIDQARIQIFRVSMFGNTLTEVMSLQRSRFPGRKLPWAQTTLSGLVLALGGKATEGVFRVSADADEVAALKAKIDNWEVPDISTITDAHAPASVLKLWYRSLYEPLVPDSMYAAAVAGSAAPRDLLLCMPPLNRLVLTYLIHFLQKFTPPEVVSQTKMDSANLAMVFAPNCLRCTSQDPRVILENARKEMNFIKNLITHLDTSHMEDLL